MPNEISGFESPAELSVRPILGTDLEALVSLGHSPKEIQHFWATSRSGQGETLVACDSKGGVLASSTITYLSGSLGGWLGGSTRVHPMARGRGIGKVLLAERRKLLRQLNARLILEFIRPDNIASLKVSASAGLTQIAFKSEVSPMSFSPRDSGDTTGSLVPIRSRGALLKSGRRLGQALLVDHLATPRRPLGAPPPHLAFPQFEIKRVLGKAPAGWAMFTPHDEVLGIRWGHTIVLAAQRGIDAAVRLMHEPSSRPWTVYHEANIAWPAEALLDQWQIGAQVLAPEGLESAPNRLWEAGLGL